MSSYGKMMLVLATAILFAMPAFAQDAPTTKWKMTNVNNPLFPKSYSLNNCNVDVRADNLGVTLQAVDRDWYGKHITETVVIEQDKWGGTSVQKYYLIAHQTNDGAMTSLDTIDYEVFWVKCLDAARQLPQDVQRAFLGHYGL